MFFGVVFVYAEHKETTVGLIDNSRGDVDRRTTSQSNCQ